MNLNQNQQLAVDTIEGPVMVIAGPGTGKTQVLTSRIAKILQLQDVTPKNILALTFTDSAAKNMKERLVKIAGTTGYYVPIMTFHAFAMEIISSYASYFPNLDNAELINEVQKYKFFEEIIDNSKLKRLKPAGNKFFHLRDIISAISNLKRENISIEKFSELVANDEKNFLSEKDSLKKTALKKQETYIEKIQDLEVLYTKYQAILSEKKLYDFDDMIKEVVLALELDENILLELQEQYQYILVDEYQDTNSSQNKLVDLLSSYWGEDANVFVVGDPHQSIYRFQGASVENMLNFVTKYPNAKVITLEEGYRCHQGVYDLAHKSILADEKLNEKLKTNSKSVYKKAEQILQEALFTKIKANKKNKDYIEVLEAQTTDAEELFIADKVKELIENGVNPTEIAVLYSKHKDAENLQNTFRAYDIPFTSKDSQNILQNKNLLQLFNLLKLIASLQNSKIEINWTEVMLYDWLDLDTTLVLKASKMAGNNYQNLYDFLSTQNLKNSEEQIQEENDFSELVAFKNKIERFAKYDANYLFHDWFSNLISNESELQGFGFLQKLTKRPINLHDLLAVNTLFEEIKKMVVNKPQFKLADFLKELEIMNEYKIAINNKEIKVDENRVEFTTVHQAKGKEWQYVFLVNCVDKHWGNERAKSEIKLPEHILTSTSHQDIVDNEDVRRLFFVAITRAKEKVFVTFAKEKTELNKSRAQMASIFINELLPEIEIGQINIDQDKITKHIELLLKSKTEFYVFSTKEKEYIAKLIEDYSINTTSLDKYLKDKKEFFFYSLLRLPSVKQPHLSFGTAMHKALESYHQRIKKGLKNMTVEEAVLEFENSLKKEVMLPNDYEMWLERGKEFLSLYLTERQYKGENTIFVERKFGGKSNPVYLQNGEEMIKVDGKIDRIDLIDKDSRTVRVFDYKTGSPKSENQILGLTKSNDISEREQALPETIRGSMKRQLIFYKLLSELDPTFDYNVADTVFDFLQPNDSGKLVSRNFIITDQDVADLKALIVEVHKEMKTLSFLDEIAL